MRKKICIVFGTRPEIIKMSPIILYCRDNNLDFLIIHSNQHYSESMDLVFLNELDIPLPNYNLAVGSSSHGNQTGNILMKIEEILIKEMPGVVLVQGDTNTVLGAALAATKLHIKVGHIEAGLRSYNRKMPEETNRVVTDHISVYLFCPTKIQEKTLIGEGIDKKKIFVVGNTISDAINLNIIKAEKKSKIMEKLKLLNCRYFLVTAHRTLTVDIEENLRDILSSIKAIVGKYDEKVVYPMHPRTKKMIEKYNLTSYLKGIDIIEPIGYFDFLILEKNAKLILTDSGGVQEEACIMKVPCVTLREDTERSETVELGANIIAGINKNKVLGCVKEMLHKEINWENPYGTGDAAKKIIDVIINE